MHLRVMLLGSRPIIFPKTWHYDQNITFFLHVLLSSLEISTLHHKKQTERIKSRDSVTRKPASIQDKEKILWNFRKFMYIIQSILFFLRVFIVLWKNKKKWKNVCIKYMEAVSLNTTGKKINNEGKIKYW